MELRKKNLLGVVLPKASLYGLIPAKYLPVNFTSINFPLPNCDHFQLLVLESTVDSACVIPTQELCDRYPQLNPDSSHSETPPHLLLHIFVPSKPPTPHDDNIRFYFGFGE